MTDALQNLVAALAAGQVEVVDLTGGEGGHQLLDGVGHGGAPWGSGASGRR